MTLFSRHFDVDRALKASPAWWNDLLCLWRPAGVPAGPEGLRLAVRSGYLNFYRKGQSVARVGFDREGTPCAHIHVKYVFPDDAVSGSRRYIRLAGALVHRNEDVTEKYAGMTMLAEWIGRAQRKAGKEKCFIDDILDLSPDVIDLEMGLSRKDVPGKTTGDPDKEHQNSALRMDIVCVHPGPMALAITFWEAKRASDGRVRCRGEFDRKNHKPEVLRQLDDYRAFVDAPGRSARIVREYRNTADVLARLRAHANTLGEVHLLGASIQAAVNGPLSVNADARLVIQRDKLVDRGWDAQHEDRLKQGGVAMVVQWKPARLSLSTT